ncbi:hypothetical protein PYCC9005_001102 [Savitreella phatthalungensis]
MDLSGMNAQLDTSMWPTRSYSNRAGAADELKRRLDQDCEPTPCDPGKHEGDASLNHTPGSSEADSGYDSRRSSATSSMASEDVDPDRPPPSANHKHRFVNEQDDVCGKSRGPQAKSEEEIRRGDDFVKINYDPIDPYLRMWGLPFPYFFMLMSSVCLVLWGWAAAYFKSGAPFLCFALLLGKPGMLLGSPFAVFSSLFGVNITFALFQTSWLFYGFFCVVCWPATFVILLLRNRWLQVRFRNVLRRILRDFILLDDRVAFFDIPLIEVDDGDVPVVLNIRGVTWTLSTMTFRVHAVEIGVQINKDIALSFSTDKFILRLFRSIEVGEVFCNVRRSNHDGKIELTTDYEQDRDKVNCAMVERRSEELQRQHSLTATLKTSSSSDVKDENTYRQRLRDIYDTCEAHRARSRIDHKKRDQHEMRALIGDRLDSKKIVPNPPRQAIKSSTLKKSVPRVALRILELCPWLFRLFLNPMSYNHPVRFEAVVVTCDGSFANDLLDQEYFDKYKDTPSNEFRKLKKDAQQFLIDGKFHIQLEDMLGLASVPMLTQYAIITYLKSPKITILKTVHDKAKQQPQPGKVHGHQHGDDMVDEEETGDVQDVAQLGGIALTCEIPEHLLPLHEDLLPPPPEDVHEPDVSELNLSVLLSLPIKLNKQMADFAMAMLKISQVLTVNRRANSLSKEFHSVADLASNLTNATKEQITKQLVEAHVDDQWLAKIIDKAVDGLAKKHGDFGYSTKVPVDRSSKRRTGKRYISRVRPQNQRATHEETSASAA